MDKVGPSDGNCTDSHFWSQLADVLETQTRPCVSNIYPLPSFFSYIFLSIYLKGRIAYIHTHTHRGTGRHTQTRRWMKLLTGVLYLLLRCCNWLLWPELCQARDRSLEFPSGFPYGFRDWSTWGPSSGSDVVQPGREMSPLGFRYHRWQLNMLCHGAGLPCFPQKTSTQLSAQEGRAGSASDACCCSAACGLAPSAQASGIQSLYQSPAACEITGISSCLNHQDSFFI